MKIAFAGLRHDHIYLLYEMAMKNKQYEVTGGYEADDAARAVAEQHGLSCRYATYQELLADQDVEVVALGGCFGDRGSMAIQALQTGKHVIADKPLCTDLKELAEIEKLAREKHLVVSCMFTMRYEGNIIAVRNLIRSGALGKINNVYFGAQHPLMYGRRPGWYFEEGKYGGLINDIAIHGIDLLSYVFDLEFDKVESARCWNRFAKEQKDFKDSGQFMLSMKDNAGVIADVSYAIPDGVEFALPYYWQFYVWGTEGTISFNYSSKEMQYYRNGQKEPSLLKAENSSNYLDDFMKIVNREKDVILPMEDVFKSTRQTLLIQQAAHD